MSKTAKERLAAHGDALAKGAGYTSYAEMATKVRIDRAQAAYDQKQKARKV